MLRLPQPGSSSGGGGLCCSGGQPCTHCFTHCVNFVPVSPVQGESGERHVARQESCWAETAATEDKIINASSPAKSDSFDSIGENAQDRGFIANAPRRSDRNGLWGCLLCPREQRVFSGFCSNCGAKSRISRAASVPR